ncbi:MAG: hypothetical protein HC802_13065, partial [Caldilineaceae bacterium]|nr:hypothetical protein [Caldilineaceae bacterium]
MTPAAFAKLQIVAPGETAAPGTPAGKSGTPDNQIADILFAVTVNAVDDFWNVVNSVVDTVSITTTDAFATVPLAQPLVAGTRNFSMSLATATTSIITATDVANGLITPASVAISAGPGAPTKLLFGQQPGSPATAGVNFSPQPIVEIQDIAGNVSLTATHTITLMAYSDITCTTPATRTLNGGGGLPAVSGVVTFTAVNYEGADDIYLRATAAGLTSACSTLVDMNPATATKLVFTQQPSSSATAGANFAQQPVVQIQDQFGNRTADSDSVTLTPFMNASCTDAASGTLNGGGAQGANAGEATFSAVNYEKAETFYLKATSGSLTAACSTSIAVTPAAFVKLQILAPGESAEPGTPSGKSGAPLSQTAGAPFNLTVNGVDAFWNKVASASDAISITTSDVNVTPPANKSLNLGTTSFSVTLKSAGNHTVTATDVTDSAKTPSTTGPITLNAAVFSKLQILAPGETALPGSASGKIGAPAGQTPAGR